ncbi:MAG: VCBS repeat-containing protein [Planctomycetes bacterium]|nr:VCBS repeat-containing protein [Planctomycetota bacterium]
MSSRSSIVLPTVVGVALLAADLAAQIVFRPPESVSSVASEGPPMTELVPADLDGDGVLDLVLTDGPFLGWFLTTHLGLGDGTFQTFVQAPLPGLQARAAADVDGDGFDEVFADDGTQLWMYAGNGDGTLGTPTPISGVSARKLLTADLNGDGLVDLVSSGGQADLEIEVLLGDGALGFDTWFTYPKSLFDPAQCVLSDLDGDGRLDLVHTASVAALQVFFGVDGGPVPPTRVELGGGLAFTVDLDVADADADGDPDLIQTNSLQVVILLNAGDGTFPTNVVLTPATGLRALLPADLDGDGKVDLALATSAGELLVQRGYGGGLFGAPLHVSHLPSGDDLFAHDVDGDGRPDVLLSTSEIVDDQGNASNEVRLLRNHTYASDAPFVDLGHALPGEQGWPILLAGGDMQPGGTWSLELRNARPLGAAVLVAGLDLVLAPFKGGTLVPSPELIVFGLPIDAAGDLFAGGAWAGGASGATFAVQWWIADDGAAQGWAASTGVAVTLP